MGLAELLITELERRFASRGMGVVLEPEVRVVFRAVHPEVGGITVDVDGDGDEVVVCLGRFTHCHFGNFDDGLRGRERDEAIVSSVVELLDAVFADRVVMWGTHDGGGGFQVFDEARRRGVAARAGEYAELPMPVFVWSGPVG